jgi:glucokinase
MSRAMRSAVFVNGVPASGKSSVARALATETGWPLLGLDTIKEAFFHHLGTGGRAYNRTLGKASYEAIFALVAEFPVGSHAIVDAWFGFQPVDVVAAYVEKAKLTKIVEVWCHAPPNTIGERYLSRVSARPLGHLGAEYVPELMALVSKAKPLGAFPLIEVDTSQPVAIDKIADGVRQLLDRPAG